MVSRQTLLGSQYDFQRGAAAGLGAEPEAAANAGGAGLHVPQALAARDGFFVESRPVVDEQPAGTTRAPEGSTVTIYVGSG